MLADATLRVVQEHDSPYTPLERLLLRLAAGPGPICQCFASSRTAATINRQSFHGNVEGPIVVGERSSVSSMDTMTTLRSSCFRSRSNSGRYLWCLSSIAAVQTSARPDPNVGPNNRTQATSAPSDRSRIELSSPLWSAEQAASRSTFTDAYSNDAVASVERTSILWPTSVRASSIARRTGPRDEQPTSTMICVIYSSRSAQCAARSKYTFAIPTFGVASRT